MVEPKRERDIKRKVKSTLTKHGWFYWMTATGGFGVSGIADICAVKQGVFMVIETKFGDRTVTAMQKGFLHSIHAEDCFAFVVNDENLVWFESFMNAFDDSAIAAGKKQLPAPETGAMMINALRELIKGYI